MLHLYAFIMNHVFFSSFIIRTDNLRTLGSFRVLRLKLLIFIRIDDDLILLFHYVLFSKCEHLVFFLRYCSGTHNYLSVVL